MKRQDTKSMNSHSLWLELLNQRQGPSSSINKSKQNNSGNLESDTAKSFYKTQEEYYDESIFLKKSIATLKGENEILKAKIRKDEEELVKKDKQMNEIISCVENQKSTQDSSINNFIVIKKLKQNIFHLKSEIKFKENEIINLKSDVKYTKINEIKIQNETYLQEVKSLQQLIFNVYSKNANDDHNNLPATTIIKSKSLKSSGKSHIIKKNKDLIIENKLLKKEIEKSDQVKMSIMDDPKIKKDEDMILEIERLKKTCKEINYERTELQLKFDDLSDKHKLLKEQFEKKETDYNLLKKKLDQKPIHNNEQLKVEKLVDSDKNNNQEVIQSICKSYINREKILEEIDNSIGNDDAILKSNLLQSAFIGYVLRHQALQK